MSHDQLLDYLKHHHVMTLATSGMDGPWASAVFYVSDGACIYFLSAPTTRHCTNIDYDSRVAATIQEDYSDWKQIKGIQIGGEVVHLHGGERDKAIELYNRKFAFMDSVARVSSSVATALQKVAWYQLNPTTLYFIDNSRGFGHREQIDPMTLKPG